jgi:hypothetical protein
VFDITNEARPIPVSTWQVPADAFCDKGGRFGPHQQAETINGRLNRFEDKLASGGLFQCRGSPRGPLRLL